MFVCFDELEQFEVHQLFSRQVERSDFPRSNFRVGRADADISSDGIDFVVEVDGGVEGGGVGAHA